MERGKIRQGRYLARYETLLVQALSDIEADSERSDNPNCIC